MRTVVYLSSLFSLLSMIWLILLPRSGGLLGFLSLRRLILLLPPTIIFLLDFFLLTKIIPESSDKNGPFFILTRHKAWNTAYWGSALLTVVAWSILFFLHLLSTSINPFINQRLLPLTVWIFSQSCLFLILHVQVKDKLGFSQSKWFLLTFLVALLFGVSIWISKLGFYTENITVNDLGVPLFEWQILYTLGILFLLTFIQSGLNADWLRQKRNKPTTMRKLILLFFILVWCSTFIAWVGQPLARNNYFLPERLPPNNQPYPFSDAERYSLEGLRWLSGNIQGVIVEKPMHALYLAFLHFLAGAEYSKIVILQIVIFSLFPAILFLVGIEIHGFKLGIGMALFAIFREINKLLTADIANVSNSQLLMSDFPAMLLLSILILLLIRWLKYPSQKRFPILLGGLVGVLSLYRAQYLIFLPLLIFLEYFTINQKSKDFIKNSLLLFFVLMLTLLPIMVHNWRISGTFWIDNPQRLTALKDYYISVAETDLDIKSDKVVKPASELEVSSGPGLVDYGMDILDNFSRNLISTILIFPIRFNGTQSLKELLELDNFWAEPVGYEHILNFCLLFLNLGLISLGIVKGGKDKSRISIILLTIFLAFNFSTALFRFSGWRFIMPVDWFIYAFYLSGFLGLLSFIAPAKVALAYPEPIVMRTNMARLLIMPFILLSSAIPARSLFPREMMENDNRKLCSLMESTLIAGNHSEIAYDIGEFCLGDDVRITQGKLLYPRFFRRQFGFYDRPEEVFFGVQDFSRLTFRLLGQGLHKFLLKTDGESLQPLPDFSLALVLSSEANPSEALVLVLPGRPQKTVISEDLFPWLLSRDGIE